MEDALGDQLKAVEAASQHAVRPDQFMVVRVDGRAFHSYTRGLPRPFDTTLMDDLDAATVALLGDMSATAVAFTQSDEISVVAAPTANPGFAHWFGGRTDKVASIAASVVTATFNQRRPGRLAHFDGRVFGLDTAAEVTDYLEWRAADARRNAISMLTQDQFTHRELHGRSTRARVEMLATVGVNLDLVHPGFRLGRLFLRETEPKTVTFTHKRTGETHTTIVDGHRWVGRPATIERVAEISTRGVLR